MDVDGVAGTEKRRKAYSSQFCRLCPNVVSLGSAEMPSHPSPAPIAAHRLFTPQAQTARTAVPRLPQGFGVAWRL